MSQAAALLAAVLLGKLDKIGDAVRGLRGASSPLLEAAAGRASPRSLLSRQGPDEMTGNMVKRFTSMMREKGYADFPPVDIVIVEGRRIIIDGHHRAAAAARAGIKEIPVRIHEVSPEVGQNYLIQALQTMER